MFRWLREYVKEATQKPNTAYEELRYIVALILKYAFISVGFILAALLMLNNVLFSGEANLPLSVAVREAAFNLGEMVSAIFGLMVIEYVLVRAPYPFLSEEERRLLRTRQHRPTTLELLRDGSVILAFAGAAFLTFHIPFFFFHYADELRFRFSAFVGLGMIAAAFAGKALTFLPVLKKDPLYPSKALLFGGAALVGVAAFLRGSAPEIGNFVAIGGLWLIAAGVMWGLFRRSTRFRLPEARPLRWLYLGLGIMPALFAAALTMMLLGYAEQGNQLLAVAFLSMAPLFVGAGYDFYYHLPRLRRKLREKARPKEEILTEDPTVEELLRLLEKLINELEEAEQYPGKMYFYHFVGLALMGLYVGLKLLGISPLPARIEGWVEIGIILLASGWAVSLSMWEPFPVKGIYRGEKVWMHFEVLPQGLPASMGYLWVRDTLYLLSFVLGVIFLMRGGQPLIQLGLWEAFLGTQVLLLYGALLRTSEMPTETD